MIRKVNKSDRDQYIAMAAEFYRSDAVLHNIPLKNIYATFEILLSESPFAEGYILELEGRTAGYALLSFAYSNEAGGPVLWVEELYILPTYRGRGMGKELLAFIEDTYKEKVVRIRLEVEATNEGAIRLYRRMGYTGLGYLQMYKTM